MKAQNGAVKNVTVTETKWLGRYCIKAQQRFNKQTGNSEITFNRWINGRFIPGENKLLPGYWTPVKYYEFDLLKKIKRGFAHMISAQ